MKILVDANIFTRKQKTGVDYYALGLVLAAARAMPNDQFILAYFGKGKLDIPSDVKNITVKRIWWLPSKMYGLHRHYLSFIPFDVLVPVKAEAMFFPDFGCPPTLQKIPKLVIIHDLVYRLQPEYVPARHRAFLEKLVAQALQQCTEVIVNSESTKNDLEQAYPLIQKPQIFINPAVDSNFYKPAPKSEIDKVKTKYGLNNNYILFLSTLEPRKNVANIIWAYDALPKELQDKHQLVLAGKKGWLDEEIEELCMKMGERVARTGRVESTEKPALYSGAAVFMYPSAYEGFGLPILEAMSCGTPVITSNISSMPEAAGGAAELVDPDSVQDITSAITRVITDKKVAQKLSTAGLRRAQEVTWGDAGKKLAETFKRLSKS